MEKLYALRTDQGVVCSQTVLQESDYTPDKCATIERLFAGVEPYMPIAGTWCRVTEDEAFWHVMGMISCIECRHTMHFDCVTSAEYHDPYCSCGENDTYD